MADKIKVVLLHNIFTPHIVPLFKRLQQAAEIDLKVFFTSFTSPERNWSTTKELGFQHEVLSKMSLSHHGKDYFSYVINPTVLYHLWKEEMDILVSAGYDSFSSQVGFFFCKAFGKSYILWSGSTHYEDNWRRRVASPLVKIMVRNADALLAYGSRSKDFLIDLGAKGERTFIAQNTVDIDYFARRSQLSDAQRHQLKEGIGIKTSRVILYVGQLIKRKGLQYLLPAFSKLKKENPDVSLLVVGRGNQERQFKMLCQQGEISDVFFVGHRDYGQLPEYYGISDVFVLPSLEEVWGLVVNEAMACSLPVIVTRVAGASADLVKEGINGFIVREGNIDDLYRALKLLADDHSLRRRMGKTSFELIQSFSIEQAAQRFFEAIEYCSKNARSSE